MLKTKNQAAQPNAGAPPPAAETAGDFGAVRIHQGVIALIARHAALQVPGVAEMSGSFADGLANIIGKTDRGVRVEMNEPDQSLRLELHVTLEYGVRIPDVAWQIQNDVRRAVTEMTGKTVAAVDVIVQEVRIMTRQQKEEKQEKQA